VRFVDGETLLRIAAGEMDVAAEHKLVAPTLVRPEALSAPCEAARRGEISAGEGLERVTRINSLKVAPAWSGRANELRTQAERLPGAKKRTAGPKSLAGSATSVAGDPATVVAYSLCRFLRLIHAPEARRLTR